MHDGSASPQRGGEKEKQKSRINRTSDYLGMEVGEFQPTLDTRLRPLEVKSMVFFGTGQFAKPAFPMPDRSFLVQYNIYDHVRSQWRSSADWQSKKKNSWNLSLRVWLRVGCSEMSLTPPGEQTATGTKSERLVTLSTKLERPTDFMESTVKSDILIIPQILLPLVGDYAAIYTPTTYLWSKHIPQAHPGAKWT
jgi:hypothetical protein